MSVVLSQSDSDTVHTDSRVEVEMRKVLLLAVSLFALFALAGCKASAITVQDNVYNALGGHVLDVDDAFTYIGHADPDVMTVANNARESKKDSGVKTRGDLFVKSAGGSADEVLIFHRMRIKHTKWEWNPVKGDAVEFEGITYKDRYFGIDEGDDITYDAYFEYIREQGYEVSHNGYLVKGLKRNHGKQYIVAIYFLVAPGSIPSSVGSDSSDLEGYLNQRLAEVVTSP